MDEFLKEHGVVSLTLDEKFYIELNQAIFSLFSVSDYIELAILFENMSPLNYASAAKKYNRIFSGNVSWLANQIIKSNSLISALGESNLIVTQISLYEYQKRPTLLKNNLDFFFRVARFGQSNDVSPAHYDQLFWDQAKGTSVDASSIGMKQRWKVWIPLEGCNEENSLRFVFGSHLLDLPVSIDSSRLTQTAIAAGAKGTPCMDPLWVDTNWHLFEPLSYRPGTFNLFHDRTVHKGPINLSSKLRLSAEFTIAVL